MSEEKSVSPVHFKDLESFYQAALYYLSQLDIRLGKIETILDRIEIHEVELSELNAD